MVYISAPKKKEAKKDALVAELTNDVKRIQAEFENYKKRTAQEIAEIRKQANADLMSELLEVMDNFELALKNTEKKDEFIKGTELIFAQLFDLCEKKGLEAIDAEGKEFDPHLHEALISEANDGPENVVLEVLQKGYMLNDKVLRHAKVKVSKKG